MRYFEQILETTTHKIAAVQPLTSHLIKLPSKTNKTRSVPQEKQNRTHKCFLLLTFTNGCARVSRPTRTLIHQLCEDIGCRLDDLPGTMDRREREREGSGWWGLPLVKIWSATINFILQWRNSFWLSIFLKT